MVDIPSANELEDWLHQLPPGYVDDVTRLFEPGEAPLFEMEHADVLLRVEALPEGSPAVRLLASVPIATVEGNSKFEIHLWQIAAATPGYLHRVDWDSDIAARELRSAVFIAPIYDGAVTKHRVLSTLLRIDDAARGVNVVGAAVREMSDDHS